MMKKARRAPVTIERMDSIQRQNALRPTPMKDVDDVIEALRIARAALEELAGIEDSQGWTQNMAARVALHKLDGRL